MYNVSTDPTIQNTTIQNTIGSENSIISHSLFFIFVGVLAKPNELVAYNKSFQKRVSMEWRHTPWEQSKLEVEEPFNEN
jgi:hypothetical protein